MRAALPRHLSRAVRHSMNRRPFCSNAVTEGKKIILPPGQKKPFYILRDHLRNTGMDMKSFSIIDAKRRLPTFTNDDWRRYSLGFAGGEEILRRRGTICTGFPITRTGRDVPRGRIIHGMKNGEITGEKLTGYPRFRDGGISHANPSPKPVGTADSISS